jgi:hypothetical protein
MTRTSPWWDQVAAMDRFFVVVGFICLFVYLFYWFRLCKVSKLHSFVLENRNLRLIIYGYVGFLKFLRIIFENSKNKVTVGWTEWQCHFLGCSSQLKMQVYYGLCRSASYIFVHNYFNLETRTRMSFYQRITLQVFKFISASQQPFNVSWDWNPMSDCQDIWHCLLMSHGHNPPMLYCWAGWKNFCTFCKTFFTIFILVKNDCILGSFWTNWATSCIFSKNHFQMKL